MADDAKTYTEDEVRALVEKEVGGLKAKVDELLGEKKTVAQRAKELEDEKTRAEEDRLKEKQEFKQLFEREQAAKKELADKYETMSERIKRRDMESAVGGVVGELTRDAKRLELLTKEALAYAKHSDDGVFFELGGVKVEAAKVVEHLRTNYPFLVDGSGATGGGATGGKNGGAVKVGDFGGDRAARQAAIKAQFKLTE